MDDSHHSTTSQQSYEGTQPKSGRFPITTYVYTISHFSTVLKNEVFNFAASIILAWKKWNGKNGKFLGRSLAHVSFTTCCFDFYVYGT